LQQRSGGLGRAARGRGRGPLQAQRHAVEVLDKGGDATDGMRGGPRVVEPLWAQALFGAVRPVHKAQVRDQTPREQSSFALS